MSNSVYGTWKVTTEGDCKGRRTRQLGTFTGHVDEIALHLANKCYYTLDFTEINPHPAGLIPTGVSTRVRINSGEVGRTFNNDARAMTDLFYDRPVKISDCNYYKSFIITNASFALAIERNKAKATALSKLTEAEKEALGVGI